MTHECDHVEMKGKASHEVVSICQQAEETHRLGGWRHDTHFYKSVLGGNLKVVKQLVEYMENNGMSDTLDWLWMRGEYEGPKTMCKKSRTRTLKKIAMFIILGILNILVTPIFYALHSLTESYVNRKQNRISERIQLPLAFAAFCQCSSMLQYFLSQGVDIDDQDEKGNNVFHYVADLSADTAECAINVFHTVVKFINDPDTVRLMLLEQRNSSGLSPLEKTAKIGSPILLSTIMKTPKLMQQDNLLASNENDNVEGKENGNIVAETEDTEEKTDKQDTARLELVDVSMYESGSIVNQSRLLNMLSDRDVAEMSKEDLSVFDCHEVVGKWSKLKTRQMTGGVLLFQLCDIAMTCILLFLLSTSIIGTMGNAFMTWKLTQDGKVQLDELSAWMNNESSILQQEAFYRLMNKDRFDMEYIGLQEMQNKTPELVEELFKAAAKNQPSLMDFYQSQSKKWNMSIELLKPNETDALYDTALTMDEFKENVTFLYIARHRPLVLEQIAHDIFHKRNEIFSGIFYLGDPKAVEFYNNLTVTYDDKELYISDALPIDEFLDSLCVSGERFQYSDLQWIDHMAPSHHVFQMTGDSCYYKLVMNCGMQKGQCDETDTHHLARLISNERHDTHEVHVCRTIVLVCTVAYILLDIFERLVFISTCTRHHSTCRSMLKTALGQKVPGSYARKQLNMFSYIFILIGKMQEYFLERYDFDHTSVDQYLRSANVASVMFILAIIIRFVMHIHSLRLLPGIGNFVITTFRMGTNLLHFSTVFGGVVLIFAILFYILIDDPNCPVQNSVGFKSLGESIFSTFKLTFGHGDLEPFFIDASVQLAYTLYVIIVCLLLLNLIIAIMSTTATDIMAEPWKSSLWKVEWLDEATSVEYAFAMIGLPFKRVSGFGYYTHRKAGFITKQMPDKQYRVYIEMFHCPKLNKFQ